MSNVKEKIKAVTSMRLFLPIVCLIAVLLVNLITTPGFFKISINNGVLYGYVVDIVNRASELVILAVGMTLVTAASGGHISIHAPHAGRDLPSPPLPFPTGISIHAPHAGRDLGTRLFR